MSPGMASDGRAVRCRTRAAGVSLIELITTMALLAIVAALGASLIAGVASGQRDAAERLNATGAADGALRRFMREMQSALPNSVRVSAQGDDVFVEFVPVLDAGRYRAAVDVTASGPGDPLDIDDPADASFDVIGKPLSTTQGAWLVLQNLGDDLSDVYAGSNRRSGVGSSGGGTRLTFTPAGPWPSVTGSHRFFLVAMPVTYACVRQGDGSYRWLRYAQYGWSSTQASRVDAPPLAGVTPALMLDHVQACSFAYTPAFANMGLLGARIAISTQEGAAPASLMQQIAIDNTP